MYNSNHSQVFKTIFTYLHFSDFFRISNLVATTSSAFDQSKQLCNQDVIINDTFLIVLVKWSKTLQRSQQGSYIMLPKLANMGICPWQAFIDMANSQLPGAAMPLFSINHSPVTQSQVRTHLSKILRVLGLDPTTHTFHTFRRSGATLAYSLDVNIQKI